uniref:Regulatory protein zeste n=1 Tax=Parascaris univalens TaxID=6257 RepID=A0A915BMC7_PARUN
HSSVGSSNTAPGSASAMKNSEKRGSTNRTKPRYRNRLRRVVREYALKVIFLHREEIYADGLSSVSYSRMQCSAIWNTILMKILHKYPSAVTTVESLKSLWRTTLSKIRKNKATLKKYSMQTAADSVMDDMPSFCDIEMDIYRWLCTTPGFQLITDSSNSLLPTCEPSMITMNGNNDISFTRSSSSSSISSDENESLMEADEDFVVTMDIQSQSDDHQSHAIQDNRNPRINKRRKSTRLGRKERDTLIRLVIHYKDLWMKNSVGRGENDDSNIGRFGFWNHILLKFREQHPLVEASTTSLKRLWRSSRNKVTKHQHDYANYLNGPTSSLPTGSLAPFSDAEVDLYRWLSMRSGFGGSESTAQTAAGVVENSTPQSDVIPPWPGEPYALSQRKCPEAEIAAADLLAGNSLAPPTLSTFTASHLRKSLSKDSLQAVRLRLVQVLSRIRYLEDELRDISTAVQMIDDEQQASIPIDEIERIKEENRRLSAENERLKKEKAEFVGSLSRYLTQTAAVNDDATDIPSKAPSVTLPAATVNNSASVALVDQHASVKDEPV